MTAYERTEYLPALEAGTLLLESSTAADYVRYKSKDGKSLKYLPFLPPNYSLYPAEELLGDVYLLKDFERLAVELGKLTRRDCTKAVMDMWTFAYYSGIAQFSSRDVYLATDGVNFQTVPLFNYEGAFSSPCEYEAIKPHKRSFQCYWHYFAQHAGQLCSVLPCMRPAIEHFTTQLFYR